MANHLMHHHLQPSVHFHECLCNAERKLCQLSTLHHSKCSMRHSLCTLHKSPFMCCHSLCTLHRSPFIAKHAPFMCYYLLAFCCAGNGYLCNIRPSLYAQHYEENLPDSMTGADFLAKYHHHYDHATQVGIAPLTLWLRMHDCHCGL